MPGRSLRTQTCIIQSGRMASCLFAAYYHHLHQFANITPDITPFYDNQHGKQNQHHPGPQTYTPTDPSSRLGPPYRNLDNIDRLPADSGPNSRTSKGHQDDDTQCDLSLTPSSMLTPTTKQNSTSRRTNKSYGFVTSFPPAESTTCQPEPSRTK
jgi:hypothetical protein